MSSIQVTVNNAHLKDALGKLAGVLDDTRPLMLEIAETLHAQSMQLFHNQGGAALPWPDLRPSTRRARAAKGHWPGKILQVTGRLASSLQTQAGADFAQVGTNVVYAAIHQFGGTIQRTGTVRLRTNAKGGLVRQKSNANLAVFASRKHKRATTRAVNYQIMIPARPFLPVSDNGQLTPPALDAVMAVVMTAFKKAA